MLLIALAWLHVSSGPARETLPAFAAEYGVQLVFGYDEVGAFETNAVAAADVDPHIVLHRMLAGTGLSLEWQDKDTALIRVQSHRLFDFHMPPSPAPEALREFVEITNMPMLYMQSDIDPGLWLNGLDVRTTAESALILLTHGTDLKVTFKSPSGHAAHIGTEAHPVRIGDHDYSCAPMPWIIGVAAVAGAPADELFGVRRVLLPYDLGLIDHDSLYCTHERPIDPEQEAALDEGAEVSVSAGPPIGGAYAPTWGPRR